MPNLIAIGQTVMTITCIDQPQKRTPASHLSTDRSGMAGWLAFGSTFSTNS